MRRRARLPWPFIVVVISSFLFGAIWGWKLIRDRAVEEGRLEAEAKLRILAPPGILTRELLLEFQRREKIEVELSVEAFPASLLRRALKSAPGQYDAAFMFHHQISALRAERKLVPLFDSRVKFPTSIAPDFRKLPNDRNLMDTAPLLWGLLGIATKKEFEATRPKIAFWPSALIGLEDASMVPSAFAAKIQPSLGGFDVLEKNMKAGPGGFNTAPTTSAIVSHGSLAFDPMKELGLKFEPLKAGDRIYYPMWIFSVAALADGDLERTRKFVKFLLEPAQNMTMIQTARVGATTLRDQEGLQTLPKELQASYLRTFPIDQILLERDERIRSADEILEQMVQGASLKIAKPVELPKPLAAAPPAKRAKAKVVEASGDEEMDGVHEEAPTDASGDGPASPTGPVTAPSEPQPHDD